MAKIMTYKCDLCPAKEEGMVTPDHWRCYTITLQPHIRTAEFLVCGKCLEIRPMNSVTAMFKVWFAGIGRRWTRKK